MEELEELKKRLEEERPMVWDGFPDIGLYMDQVISYVSRQLITYDGGETLTPPWSIIILGRAPAQGGRQKVRQDPPGLPDRDLRAEAGPSR